MRIGILARPESYYFRELSRAAAGDDVVALTFESLRSEIGGSEIRVNCCEHDLSKCDAILVRTMPPGSLEQVILRMDLLEVLRLQGTLVVNPPKALEAAVDKFLTSARLRAAGIPTPHTIACQTWESAMAAFQQLGGKAVVKPLFGGEGRGISLLTDADMAHRAFKLLSQLGAVIYLQEYIEHGGSDLRILLVGEETFAVKRINPSDWRTNASRGAKTVAYQPTTRQLDLALKAAELIGAPIAGVDLLSGPTGEEYVIEVNAVPGWRATANALQIDIAHRVIDWVRAQVKR